MSRHSILEEGPVLHVILELEKRRWGGLETNP